MASKKRRKNQAKAPEINPELAEQHLQAGRYREALTQYKGLLKQQDCADWRAGLAAAYHGRAHELAAKGMLKEAAAVWDNLSDLRVDVPLQLDDIQMLLRIGRATPVIAAYQRLDPGAKGEQAQALRTALAAADLGAGLSLEEKLAADDPLIRYGEPARQALNAYCQGEPAALAAALEQIPFRSPYRDLVQILKALTKLPDTTGEAAAQLQRIPAVSGFAGLRDAALLATLPESEFMQHLAQLPANTRHLATALRGWSAERLAFWERLQRIQATDYPALSQLVSQHQQAFGDYWATQYRLRLDTADAAQNHHGMNRLMQHWRQGYEALVADAWSAEGRNALPAILKIWDDVDQYLQKTPGGHTANTPNALRRAQIAHRLVHHWRLLEQDYVPDKIKQEVATFAEQCLALDPDYIARYIALISYHRGQGRLKAARRILDAGLARAPQHTDLLNEGLDTALASKAFKKAAGFAKRILALDPINRRAQNHLIDAHLEHAHKQAAKHRYDLAHKAITEAMAWDTQGQRQQQLAIAAAVLTACQDHRAGKTELEQAIAAYSEPLRAHLEWAIEAHEFGWAPNHFAKTLQLKVPQRLDKAGFIALTQHLRKLADDGRRVPAICLQPFTKALNQAKKLKLDYAQAEWVCEALARCGLDQWRLQFANKYVRAFGQTPLFVLHHIAAEFAVGQSRIHHSHIQRLITAMRQAEQNNETRTRERLRGLLTQIENQFPWLRPDPFGMPESALDDDDDTGKIDAAIDSILESVFGGGDHERKPNDSARRTLEIMLDSLEATDELPEEFRQLEQDFGRETLIDILLEMEAQSGLPLPLPQQSGPQQPTGHGRKKPRKSKSTNKPKRNNQQGDLSE